MDPDRFCTYFMKTGRCRYGERCRDVHPYGDDVQAERMRIVTDERMDVSDGDSESADSDQYGGSTTMGDSMDAAIRDSSRFLSWLSPADARPHQAETDSGTRSTESETSTHKARGASIPVQSDRNQTSHTEEACAPRPSGIKTEELVSLARTRHPDYYFEDGNMMFLVEGHQYNLHRGFIRCHSQFFSDSFPCPQSNNMEHPLDDIKSKDFECLLRVVCPLNVGELNLPTLEEWTAVLELSSRWKFDFARKLAIQRIDKLLTDPIDRILVSRKFDVCPEWIIQSHITLCERVEPLSVDEAKRLNSVETVALLAIARERVQNSMKSPLNGFGRKEAVEAREKLVTEVLNSHSACN